MSMHLCGCGRLKVRTAPQCRACRALATAAINNHPLYSTWRGMKNRCRRPKDLEYHNYGGRGIFVCDAWRNDFWQFANDMGERPLDHSLDRINNDGPYSPENCRWATPIVQSHNSRKARFIEYRGERLCCSEWAERLGISKPCFLQRIKIRGQIGAIELGSNRGNGVHGARVSCAQ